MSEFIVLDVNAERRLVTLLDAMGRYHVAFATTGMPAISTYVRGFTPERGFGLLIETGTRIVYRILFEAIDCGHEKAVELLHGSLRAGMPLSRGGVTAPPAIAGAVKRSSDPWESLAPERRADRMG
jgi:hypothetical protein